MMVEDHNEALKRRDVDVPLPGAPIDLFYDNLSPETIPHALKEFGDYIHELLMEIENLKCRLDMMEGKW